MMNFPANIKIGGTKYKVEPLSSRESRKQGVWGRISFDDNVIEIAMDGVDSQRVRLALLHEIFHGIVHNMCLKELTEFNEELFVAAMSEGVNQVLLDNPGLMEMWNGAPAKA